MAIPVPSSPLFTVAEAARYVRLSKSLLNKLRVTGGGPVFVKLGGRVFYQREGLDAWIAAGQRRSTSQG